MNRAMVAIVAVGVLAALCVSGAVRAQGTEPGGGQGEPLPAGHPPLPAGGGHGDGPRRAFDASAVASAEPSALLPSGTVRVTVVDEEGRPVDRASVLLGRMAQGGDRTRVSALTDATGVATFRDLATGSGQAYRVNVPYEGATYSSTPFQLPPDHGYEVRIVRLPVTHDDRALLQLVGQTFVEIREDRLHVIQQAQLGNMSQTPRTYVFPEGGLRIRLPEGYLAFQAQPVMTDQHIEEIAGFGMRIRGSLPPGRATLVWAFDLPIRGSDMDVVLRVPFRTYIYRVITDAPAGMRLEVDPLPPVQAFEDEGRPLFGTEIERRPGDRPLDEITLRFRGIPGPGPMRWVALFSALAVLAIGIVLAIRGGDPVPTAARNRARRKRELLEEAARLEEDFARGEIGPRYRQSRRAAIVRELAVLLHQEQAAAREKRSGASRA